MFSQIQNTSQDIEFCGLYAVDCRHIKQLLTSRVQNAKQRIIDHILADLRNDQEVCDHLRGKIWLHKYEFQKDMQKIFWVHIDGVIRDY